MVGATPDMPNINNRLQIIDRYSQSLDKYQQKTTFFKKACCLPTKSDCGKPEAPQVGLGDTNSYIFCYE